MNQPVITNWLARFGPFLLIGALYLFGVWLIVSYVVLPRQLTNKYQNQNTIAYLASRYLPANTLLRLEHLVPPRDLPPGYFWFLPKLTDLQGKYLKADVSEGDAITTEDVRPWPEVKTLDQIRAIPLKDQSAADFVNAGTIIDLCPMTGKCEVYGVRVQAVICSRESPPLCQAIIPLTNEAITRVLETPSLRILLKAFP